MMYIVKDDSYTERRMGSAQKYPRMQRLVPNTDLSSLLLLSMIKKNCALKQAMFMILMVEKSSQNFFKVQILVLLTIHSVINVELKHERNVY